MLQIKVIDSEVRAYLAAYPKQASRALETAIDKTAYSIRDAEKREMRRVFNRPVAYTLNSLKVTRTRNHNMKASVWLKEPDRMQDHYLVPQVDGGKRKLKGFERALDNKKFVPGRGARMTAAGNVSTALLRKVVASTRLRSHVAKSGDMIYLSAGSAKGKLPPGVYERTVARGSGFGGAAKKSLASSGKFQKGRRRGRFYSVVRARGLKPVLIHGKQQAPVKPLFRFYQVADRQYRKVFAALFAAELARRVGP